MSLTSACERQVDEYDQYTLNFWNQNPKVHAMLQQEGSGNCVAEEEKKLCDFISHAFIEYPNVITVSDNPHFDMAIMNNILQKYQCPPIALRSGRYFRPLCTWSFAQAFRATKHVIDNNSNTGRDVDKKVVIRHHPFWDCCWILSQHFKMLDAMKT